MDRDRVYPAIIAIPYPEWMTEEELQRTILRLNNFAKAAVEGMRMIKDGELG